MRSVGRAAGVLLVTAVCVGAGAGASGFDHGYAEYGELLQRHVRAARVNYAALKNDRTLLDRVVATFDSEDARAEATWARGDRMAFWINAYNAFTLRVIVDHYPIRARWFTLQPRNSIRQIDGVWTDLTWPVAGRRLTLDDIEHRLLRPEFRDARIHFAINCASVSCPPLRSEPYVADRLDRQLDEAARAYLASTEGLRVEGDRFRVSSIFEWYGEDFVTEYAPLVIADRDVKERAILGAIVRYGPPDAAARAQEGRGAIRFLAYNWSLNDTAAVR